jgi:hypothetical protein
MRHRIVLLASAACIALAGCATGTATQDIEKGLISAHIAFEASGVALRAAATSGVLKDGAAQTAQAAYDTFADDLAQADADWNAGNSGAVGGDLAKTTSDQARVAALVPKP